MSTAEFRFIFLNGATHCRITNVLIDDFSPSDKSTKYTWVMERGGHYNRIDHCHFKNMTHDGYMIAVDVQKNGGDPVPYIQIDHNFFDTRAMSPGSSGEAIKIGGGPMSGNVGGVTIEYNYFYDISKEVEVVSIKAHENIVRYNTFILNSAVER